MNSELLNFVDVTIIRIDMNSIYLSNGSIIDFHACETYFNTSKGDCFSIFQLLESEN